MIDGDAGVYFCGLGAENAASRGRFQWLDGRVNPMRRPPGSGVLNLFPAGVLEGAHYKFEIRAASPGALF